MLLGVFRPKLLSVPSKHKTIFRAIQRGQRSTLVKIGALGPLWNKIGSLLNLCIQIVLFANDGRNLGLDSVKLLGVLHLPGTKLSALTTAIPV